MLLSMSVMSFSATFSVISTLILSSWTIISDNPDLPLNDLLRSLFEGPPAVCVPKLGDGLREVTVNPPLIDQHIIHACVRLNARLLTLILNECILQRVTGFPVADDLAGGDGAEAREDEFEVMRLRHRVELAHEEHVLRRLDVGVRQVL